jgi:hypothetical protein
LKPFLKPFWQIHEVKKLSLKKRKKENLHVLKSWIFSLEGLSLLLVLRILYGGLIIKYPTAAFFLNFAKTLGLICIWIDGFSKKLGTNLNSMNPDSKGNTTDNFFYYAIK